MGVLAGRLPISSQIYMRGVWYSATSKQRPLYFMNFYFEVSCSFPKNKDFYTIGTFIQVSISSGIRELLKNWGKNLIFPTYPSWTFLDFRYSTEEKSQNPVNVLRNSALSVKWNVYNINSYYPGYRTLIERT